MVGALAKISPWPCEALTVSRTAASHLWRLSSPAPSGVPAPPGRCFWPSLPPKGKRPPYHLRTEPCPVPTSRSPWVLPWLLHPASVRSRGPTQLASRATSPQPGPTQLASRATSPQPGPPTDCQWCSLDLGFTFPRDP